jgi:hypothetical protein
VKTAELSPRQTNVTMKTIIGLLFKVKLSTVDNFQLKTLEKVGKYVGK